MRISRTEVVFSAGTLALVGALSLVKAQEQQTPSVPPLVISSLAGRDLFQAYCATCHGRTGKGDGPVANSLKNRPADLTAIASRNGGRFPREQVERYVKGEDLGTVAHGSREMPVWGPIFHGLDPRDTVNRVRIANLIEFIESMQTRQD